MVTPLLEAKAVHGLAEPEEYVYPEKHELWTPATYDSFHIFKAVDAKEKAGVSYIFCLI
jgi:hypothetical protein